MIIREFWKNFEEFHKCESSMTSTWFIIQNSRDSFSYVLIVFPTIENGEDLRIRKCF